MSMFGSLEKDYEAWKASAADRGLDSIPAGYADLIQEAYLAGAAAVLGGAGKTKASGGIIENFLAQYRDEVNEALRSIGIMVGRNR